jgi:glucosamine--fructose-6-phosphate aminotransferase (isomerizing)
MSLKNTHLYQEIHEQPTVLERVLLHERPIIEQLAQAIKEHDITHVVIAARGTSDNAGRYAQYVLGSLNGLTVALATPSLFTIYQQPPRFGNALVLGISQSGKSPDIVAVVAEAKRQGALTAVFTNTPDSDMAQHGDFVINLQAGPEKSVAATKTYSSALMAIASLGAALSGEEKPWDALQRIPIAVSFTLGINDAIAQVTPRYRYMERSIVIGRGYNYATAFEMALKMKELTYTIVEPFSSADFLHGPLALIEPGFPVFVIAPTGKMQAEMAEFIATLHQQKAEVICLSDVPDLLKASRIPLLMPQTVPEWLSPITAIVPGQLFALHLAHTRDFDVDAPRTIQKVTETH